jgi:hypothetical protein
MTTKEVLNYCKKHTQIFIDSAENLKNEPLEKLQWKASPSSWSALECLEHLNLYADFYNPAILNAINKSHFQPVENFKAGFLGNYFAKSMLPQKKMKKMKTFKDKNPCSDALDINVLHKFISQQQEFQKLLQLSEKTNLNKVKTPITITRLLKLKLGDTLQFLVNHNIRHFAQLENCLKEKK